MPTIRACALVVVVLSAVAVLAGCGEAGKVKDAVRVLQAHSGPPDRPFETDAVAKGARQLEEQLGGPVRVLNLEISDHGIVFQVQDPAQPANVDAYELRNGELLGPQPVQLMGDADLEASLYPLAEVPLDRVPELAKAAAAALALEGGKVSSMRVHRRFSAIRPEMREALDRARRSAGIEPRVEKPDVPDGGVAVEIYVDSPRRKGYVLADGGNFEIVRQNVL